MSPRRWEGGREGKEVRPSSENFDRLLAARMREAGQIHRARTDRSGRQRTESAQDAKEEFLGFKSEKEIALNISYKQERDGAIPVLTGRG